VTDTQAIKELASTRCRCGAVKRAYDSFCLACYRRLPQEERRRLYTQVENGYAEIYENAVKLLGLP